MKEMTRIKKKPKPERLFVIYDEDELPLFVGNNKELREYLEKNYTREEQATLDIVTIEEDEEDY